VVEETEVVARLDVELVLAEHGQIVSSRLIEVAETMVPDGKSEVVDARLWTLGCGLWTLGFGLGVLGSRL
jgi:hypothetical protein